MARRSRRFRHAPPLLERQNIFDMNSEAGPAGWIQGDVERRQFAPLDECENLIARNSPERGQLRRRERGLELLQVRAARIGLALWTSHVALAVEGLHQPHGGRKGMAPVLLGGPGSTRGAPMPARFLQLPRNDGRCVLKIRVGPFDDSDRCVASHLIRVNVRGRRQIGEYLVGEVSHHFCTR